MNTAPAHSSWPEHRIFLGAAGVIVLLVTGGFARTYFLRPWLGLGPLSGFIHLHGAVMLAWILVFATQVGLIAWHRPAWHRRLGWVGVVNAAAVVIMGTTATWLAAMREVAAQTTEATLQVTVLGLELTQMLLFGSMVYLAVLWRNRPAYHKRLMLMATIAMLPNPIVRSLQALHVHSIVNTTILIIATATAALVVVDSVRRQRLHPAFGFGAVAIIGGLVLADILSSSAGWHSFASRMVTWRL